jgi:hypothetical protein
MTAGREDQTPEQRRRLRARAVGASNRVLGKEAWTLLARAISQMQLVEGTRLTEGKALCRIDP